MGWGGSPAPLPLHIPVRGGHSPQRPFGHDSDVYRVRLIAPPTPCTVTMRYPMPYRPGPIEHDDTPHAAEPSHHEASTDARTSR